MSGKLDNIRVRRAMKELSHFFGLGEVNPTLYPSFPDIKKSESTAAWFHDGTTYAPVSTIFEIKNEDLPDLLSTTDTTETADLGSRVIVTSYEESFSAGADGNAIIAFENPGFDPAIGGQGWRAPSGDISTIRGDVLPKDLREHFEKKKKETTDSGDGSFFEIPIHVVQVFDPLYSASAPCRPPHTIPPATCRHTGTCRHRHSGFAARQAYPSYCPIAPHRLIPNWRNCIATCRR